MTETTVALPAQPQATSQGTAVEQTRAAAEVAAAVSVARNFPRDPLAAVDAMRELCGRLPVAQRAFYEVPNRGAGLSVHIARELARIWGNLDYGVRELGRDDVTGISEMTVWAWDQETNVRSTRSFLVPHQKMVGKGAEKRRQAIADLGDIYLNNQNVGARAVRESIFSVLPGWLLADAEALLKRTLENGDGKPIEDRRADALAKFEDLTVTRAQMETRIGKPLAQWAAKDIAALSRAYTSITVDGIGVHEFFPEEAITVPVKELDPADPNYVDPAGITPIHTTGNNE